MENMENINLKINGLDVSAPAGSTILEAAHLAGIRIPTLCYLKEINEIGAQVNSVVFLTLFRERVSTHTKRRSHMNLFQRIGYAQIAVNPLLPH